MRLHQPHEYVGSTKVEEKFLWYPLTLEKTGYPSKTTARLTVWLERVKIKYRLMATGDQQWEWEPIAFVDDDGEDMLDDDSVNATRRAFTLTEVEFDALCPGDIFVLVNPDGGLAHDGKARVVKSKPRKVLESGKLISKVKCNILSFARKIGPKSSK